jgi:hypothetical protein
VRPSDKKQTRFMPLWLGDAGGRLKRNKFSIKPRLVFGTAGSTTKRRVPHPLRSFAKGGIRDGRYRDSWYPTLRQKREGWGTRQFRQAHHALQEIWGTLRALRNCHGCYFGRLSGEGKKQWWAPPGFPVWLGEIKDLHAAFLTESRTREYGWRRVQEIRVARLFRPTYAGANVGHPAVRAALLPPPDLC